MRSSERIAFLGRRDTTFSEVTYYGGKKWIMVVLNDIANKRGKEGTRTEDDKIVAWMVRACGLSCVDILRYYAYKRKA